jgi:hypothetical protein
LRGSHTCPSPAAEDTCPAPRPSGRPGVRDRQAGMAACASRVVVSWAVQGRVSLARADDSRFAVRRRPGSRPVRQAAPAPPSPAGRGHLRRDGWGGDVGQAAERARTGPGVRNESPPAQPDRGTGRARRRSARPGWDQAPLPPSDHWGRRAQKGSDPISHGCLPEVGEIAAPAGPGRWPGRVGPLRWTWRGGYSVGAAGRRRPRPLPRRRWWGRPARPGYAPGEPTPVRRRGPAAPTCRGNALGNLAPRGSKPSPKMLRRFGPPRAGGLGLGAEVEGTGADGWNGDSCRGGVDRRTQRR